MAFNPKAYAAQSKGFDPKAYAGVAKPEIESSFGGELAAALQGFSRGASMGQSDDAMATAEAAAQTGSEDALLQSINPMVAIPSQANFERSGDKFQKIYQENIDQQEKLKEAYPNTAMGTEIAGGLVSGPSELIGSAAFGAAGRGLKAVGGTRAGQAVAGGVSRIASPIKNRIAALGDDLGTLAEKNALRSAGAQKSQMKSLVNKGKVKDVGRFIIDENIVPPGASADEIFETAATLKKSSGEDISKVFDEIDSAGSGGKFNRKNVAADMRKAILDDPSVGGSLDADKVVAQLDKYIADFEAKKGAASARDLLELKGKFDARINYSKKAMELPELQQGYRNLRTTINDTINQRAENLSNKVRGKLGDRLKAANKRYGLAAEVENIAENRLAQEGNKFFSLSDSIAGAAGAGAGLVTGGLASIPMAAGAALGNRALRTYGPSVGTKALDALSKGAKSITGTGTKKIGEKAASTASRIAALESNPGVGRKPFAGSSRAKLRLKAMGE